MRKLQLTIHPLQGEPVELEAADMASALAIADINAERGPVEIFEGGRKIARISRQGNGRATYWHVG